jgi:hypothetical protein
MNVRNVCSFILTVLITLIVVSGYSTQDQWKGGPPSPTEAQVADGTTLTADGGSPAPPYPKPNARVSSLETLTADGGSPAPPYPKPNARVSLLAV